MKRFYFFLSKTDHFWSFNAFSKVAFFLSVPKRDVITHQKTYTLQLLSQKWKFWSKILGANAVHHSNGT